MDPMRMALIGGAAFLLWKYMQGSAAVTPVVTTPITGTPIVGSGTSPVGSGTTPVAPAVTPSSGFSATQATWDSLWNNAPGALNLAHSQFPDSQSYVIALAADGNPQAMAMADSKGTRFNVDQWNYYRTLSGESPISPDDMPRLLGSGPRETAISSTEYRSRLAGAGLSGFYSSDVSVGMGSLAWY